MWLAFVVATLGLAFGFVGVVAAVAHAAWFHLPAGVAAQDYVSVGRHSAISGRVDRLAAADVAAIRERVPEVRWFAVERLMDFKIEDAAGTPYVVAAEGVSGNYFDALGVAPAGTLATPDEQAAIVVDARLGRILQGDADALPSTVAVEGGAVPLLGAAPAEFSGVLGLGDSPRLWVLNPTALPANMAKSELQKLGAHSSPIKFPFGVLPTNAAAGRLDTLRALLADYRFVDGFTKGNVSSTNTNVSADDRPAITAGLEVRPAMRTSALHRVRWLVAIAAFLIALALVGLADFLLTEQLVADEELAARVAVGATPASLFGEYALGNAGWLLAVGAIASAAWSYLAGTLLAVEPFASWLGEFRTPSIAVGLGLTGLALVVAFATAIGLAVRSALKAVGAAAAHRRYRRTVRRLLLFTATASLLLVASTLVRYVREANFGLGLDNRDALMVFIWAEKGVADEDDVRAILEGLPTVRAAGRMGLMPFLAPYDRRTNVRIVGETGLEDVAFFHSGVTRDYFTALGIHVLAGRLPSGVGETVVSRAAALRFGSGNIREAVGRAIRVRGDKAPGGGMDEVLAVVGVVADVPYGEYLDAPLNVVYSLVPGSPWDQRWVIDHVGPAADVLAALSAAPALEGFEVTPIGTPAWLFDAQFMAVRSVEIVLAGAAILALVLSLAGIVNALAARMAADRRALGIGLALGATPWVLAEGYLGEGAIDLLVAVALPFGALMAAGIVFPTLGAATEPLNRWLMLPAAGMMAAVAAAVIYGLARRYASGDAHLLLKAGPGAGRR